jgi:integrase
MSQQSLKQTLKFKFTEASVLAVSIPDKRERTYTDAHTQGLALRVLNTGIRTYYARLWNPRTKTTRRIKIGDASVVSLRYARDTVCDLRQAQEERRHRPAERVCVLSDVFEAFIVERRARGCTEGYIGQNQRAWQQVPSELRGRELDEIVANDLDQPILALRKTHPGSAQHLRRLLKGLWRLSMINRWCKYNATLDLPTSATPPRRERLSDDDLHTLLEGARRDAHNNGASDDCGAVIARRAAMLMLLAATGQRMNEVRTLLWSDITDEAIVFRAENRKQAKDHTVYRNDLADEAISILKTHRDDISPCAELLPAFGRHEAYNYSKRLSARLGITHVYPHLLRKTLISRLLSKGVPVHVVQQVSGHADASILLKHYAIAREDEAQAAVKALRF